MIMNILLVTWYGYKIKFNGVCLLAIVNFDSWLNEHFKIKPKTETEGNIFADIIQISWNIKGSFHKTTIDHKLKWYVHDLSLQDFSWN